MNYENEQVRMVDLSLGRAVDLADFGVEGPSIGVAKVIAKSVGDYLFALP